VSTPLQPALADLLGYLKDIGYGDLYLTPSPLSPALSPVPGEREQSKKPLAQNDARGLAALAAVVEGCTRCRLAQGRQRVVFGSGNPDADLMFIGEGPGAEEDRQGLPFVGAAGELLTKIIQAMDMRRDDVYIANIVKCRPPGNRDPQPDEVAACRGYLERQIELVNPRLIVILGKVAAQTLLGNESPIGQMRGQWYQVRGIPTMITYHPAALLRNQALKRPTWEDMQQVRDRLREAGRA
jgi:uracil-DNA glycosylase family 4